MTDVVLGLDVGGTKLLGGLVDAAGRLLLTRRVDTPRDGDRCDPGLVAVRALAGSLAAEGAARGHALRAAGIGFPEYVRDGRLTSTEVFAWDRQPSDVLAGALPGPVVVEADVRCAALAEARARAGDGPPSFVYVSWGTGLSSTVVVDGRCVPGERGEALALGEWPVDPRGGVVWDGTLEAFASGRALRERYAAATGAAVGGAALEERADAGDAIARTVLASAAEAVARAVCALVQVLDPPLVVLGGGVGTSGGLLPRAVSSRAATLLARPGAPAVEPARAGDRAGLVGAGLLAWDVLRDNRS